MKKTNYLSFIFLFGALLGSQVVSAQEPCGIVAIEQQAFLADSIAFVKSKMQFVTAINHWRDDHAQDVYKEHQNTSIYRIGNGDCNSTKYLVPVVVHIIHLGGAENISDSQVHHGIKVLNDEFANASNTAGATNTQIQFCLATHKNSPNAEAITRTVNVQTHHRIDQLAQLFALQNWDREKYLHIYIVNEILDSNGNASGINGYATFPEGTSALKGIVIRYDQFGDSTQFGTPLATNSRGKTLVHEMGHFLGLRHPFDFGCVGLDSVSCKTDGDLCCDVPAVMNEYYTCPALNSCRETYNNNPADQRENYMDYSPQTCTNTFTKDQTSLMHGTLEQYKAQMISFDNLIATKPQCCMLTAQFEASRVHCFGDSIFCKALPYTPAVTSIWEFYRNDSLVHTATTAANEYSFNAPAVISSYDIRLMRIFDNGDTLKNFQKNYMEVFDCTDTLRSPHANWYFGKYTEWKFGNNMPFPRWDNGPRNSLSLPGIIHQIDANEGTLSVSDSMGRLLFYGGVEKPSGANGFLRIFDNQYKEMTGSPIRGFWSAGAGAISFPRPFYPKQYYIAHVDNNVAYYSIVDMNVIGVTNGAIIAKDILLDPSNTPFQSIMNIGEGVNAVQSCNPHVWFVYSVNQDVSAPYIYVYRADSAGFQFQDTIPVAIANNDGVMLLEISPDGSLMSYNNQIFQINRATGGLTLWHTDENPAYNFSRAAPAIWGVSFSPNSKLLYRYIEHSRYYDIATSSFVDPTVPFGLYQFDLSSQAADLGKTLITSKQLLEAGQLGPDGKLYYVNQAANFSSVVTKPNTLIENSNADVGYIANGPKTGVGNQGGRFDFGLPHLVDALPALQVAPDFRFTIVGCDSVVFESNQCCATAINWNFGDGNTGSGKFVGHRYATKDSFTVTMNADGKVNTQTVKFPFFYSGIHILGSSQFCDTGLNGNTTAIYKAAYDYNWSGKNLTNTYVLNNTYNFKVHKDAEIYLHVIDSKTGCQDFDTLIIQFDTSQIINTLDPSTNVFCSGDTIRANGNTVTGGTGVYHYFWQYSTDSLNWEQTADTTKDMTIGFKSELSKYYVRRVVLHGNCIYYSAVKIVRLFIEQNLIKFAVEPCIVATAHIADSGHIVNASTYNFGYQLKMFLSDTWTTLNQYNQSNLAKMNQFDTAIDEVWYNNYAHFTSADSFYIRRYIKTNNCESYSNILHYKKKFKMLQQPNDVYVCNTAEGGRQDHRVTWQVWNPYNYDYSFLNETLDSGNSLGTFIFTVSNKYERKGRYVAANSGKYTATYHYLVYVPGCGESDDYFFTEPYKIHVNTMVDTFSLLTHPKDALVSNQDSVLLNSKASITEINAWTWELARVYDSGYTQTVLNDKFIKNYIISDSFAKDTIKVYGMVNDSNARHYRAVAHNGCYTIPSNWAMINNRNYDIYMKDFFAIPSQNLPEDDGSEPNKNGYRNYTHSYDIWVSDNPNWPQPTEWIGMDIFHPDADTQYVKVKIRNRSNQTSSPATLQLYWTNASTAEEWPKHWTKNAANMRPNDYFNRDFYEGGKINKFPITIPPIAANGSTIITFKWPKLSDYADSVPQNTWFRYTKPDSTRDYAAAQGICLLARIQHCENNNCNPDSSDGMAFKERKGNVAYNIIYNNNVASTNMRRLYLNPPKDDPFAFVMENPIRVRSMNEVNGYNPVWKLHSVNNNFDNIGEAYVYMDYNFWTIWNTQSQPGQHFSVLAPGVIKMTNKDSMVLGPINVQPGFAADLGFGYNLKPGGTPTGGDTAYSFDFVQSYTDSVVHFEGIVSTYFSGPQFINLGGGNNGYGDMVEEEKEKEDSTQMKEFIQNLANNQQVAILETTFETENTNQIKDNNPLAKTNNITVYPNPFTDILKVDVTNTKTSKVSIWITDLNGKIVAKSIINQGIAAGKTQFSIHGSSLAAGTYIVHIQGVHQYIQKKKVMLIR